MATPRPFGRGPFGAMPYSRGLNGPPRQYGVGAYSASVYSTPNLTHGVGGATGIGFALSGEVALAWAVPAQMCEPGTWTLTSLPTGPPNELEPA
jgi:hypothetical protein